MLIPFNFKKKKKMMKEEDTGRRRELVFVPSIGMSHLVPTVQFAKRLISCSDQFTISFLIIPSERFTDAIRTFIDTVTATVPRIQFIILPPAEELLPPNIEPGVASISLFVENHKLQVKHAITKLFNDLGSSQQQLAGLVLDMFTATMVDIGTDLGIPSYMYYTSSAAMAGFMLHLPLLHDQITIDLKDYSGELLLPSYVNPVPPFTLPSPMLDRESQGYKWSINTGRKFREMKGFIVNSLLELEPQAVDSFVSNILPRVYTVGPILDLENQVEQQGDAVSIINWLDNQPRNSVVFLCFGSRGTLSPLQVKEVASGLERSGHRFLWSLRKPATTISFRLATDYKNPDDVLPEGFLSRTAETGMVCGWAPQVEVLSHEAVGGFVSHCGWNSTLESLWFGVPILTWPLDAEQRMNAFQMVKDLGLAVELRADYNDRLITALEVETGIRRLMDMDDIGGQARRRKVHEMGEKCRKGVMEGGSSFNSLRCFVEDLG